MVNILSEFPQRKALEQWFRENGTTRIREVNAHIHSPYSFSAFNDLRQAFEMARSEQVQVLGINDFNTTEGFAEFNSLSREYRIFPLFNIEFMGLMKEEQQKGIRINDPNNPGRIYFSGKGLDFPVNVKAEAAEKLQGIVEKSHLQVKAMIRKLNLYLEGIDGRLKLDFGEVYRCYAKSMVRERHIALALRVMIFERFKTPGERTGFLKQLYGNHDPAADIDNNAEVENEIRGRLLKSGGVAFVEEDPGGFLELEDIISIITGAGGIPCYPVLLDDPRGLFTEFESDMRSLCGELRSLNVSCIELIPGRNDPGILKKFVSYFRDRGFVILLGSEHNTPSLEPIRLSARGGVPLDDEITLTAYNGACVIAAHQYLRAKEESTGYITLREAGKGKDLKNGLEELGKAVIERYLI